ncbi:cytochrome C biogenesis protein [archaeon]|mgnify:FL=1|nr:cytochrome C biogenesis protein [archaeon]
MAALTNIWLSFLAGVFAPLGAVCVLPLYPGFLAYLASQVQERKSKDKSLSLESNPKKLLIQLALLVTAGIILSLFIVGLLFTKLLQISLTTVTSYISPIAFILLAIISIILIADIEISKYLPQIQSPKVKNPYLTSLLFGIFFGIIVLPCNPASLVILFALSTSVTSFIQNLLGFLAFAVGMALPLLILSLVSAQYSRQVIGFLTNHKTIINRTAGVLMMAIALYYLFFVFKIF